MVTPNNKSRNKSIKIDTKINQTHDVTDTFEKRNKIGRIKQSPEKLKNYQEFE